MKFGGTSMSSAASLARVISIVRSHAHRRPVVVASAMGDTTDDLLQILSHARRAETYLALKLQDDVKSRHFAACDELLHGDRHANVERFFRDAFRALHIRMLELAEGECAFTPELQDWTASFGEQLSSRLLAEVLDEYCGPAVHLEARKLILTDDRFTSAQPRYWETYARVRWAVSAVEGDSIPVLGGFIGSTVEGRTTTMGRGGSDLTASIVGAALNADEIQVWKDVDGLLTCDPRQVKGGCPVRSLSCEEAAQLARAGATILHPETMGPARRLRIPIAIRNTFHPEHCGTRIEEASSNFSGRGVKSIAVQTGITLLDVRPGSSAEVRDSLDQLCSRTGSGTRVVCSTDEVVFLAREESSEVFEQSFAASPYMEVRIRTGQAILTLVGRGMDHNQVSKQVNEALTNIPFFAIPDDTQSGVFRLALAQEQTKKAIASLHQAFFDVSPLPVLAEQTTTQSSDQQKHPNGFRRLQFTPVPVRLR